MPETILAQGLESRPFWLPAIRRPGKRTGHRAFQIGKVIQPKNTLLNSDILTINHSGADFFIDLLEKPWTWNEIISHN